MEQESKLNRVLQSMLKGATKNPVVFGLVISFVTNALANVVKAHGLTDSGLMTAIKQLRDAIDEFLTDVESK